MSLWHVRAGAPRLQRMLAFSLTIALGFRWLRLTFGQWAKRARIRSMERWEEQKTDRLWASWDCEKQHMEQRCAELEAALEQSVNAVNATDTRFWPRFQNAERHIGGFVRPPKDP